jgi:hypothetical protein
MPDRSRRTSRPYAGDVEATGMRGRGVAPPGAPVPQEPRAFVGVALGWFVLAARADQVIE